MTPCRTEGLALASGARHKLRPVVLGGLERGAGLALGALAAPLGLAFGPGVEAGAGVSYGYTHRTEAATTLGLVGLGYADGVPRLGSNRAELAIDGTRHRLVGRIAMDQLVIDLGDALPAVTWR